MTDNLRSNDAFFDTETWYVDSAESIALVVLHGTGKHVINKRSTTTYEAVTGSGVFMLDGDDCILLVGKGDKLTVEAGQAYQDFGHLVMLARSMPPFDPDHVEIIENRIQ